MQRKRSGRRKDKTAKQKGEAVFPGSFHGGGILYPVSDARREKVCRALEVRRKTASYRRGNK